MLVEVSQQKPTTGQIAPLDQVRGLLFIADYQAPVVL